MLNTAPIYCIFWSLITKDKSASLHMHLIASIFGVPPPFITGFNTSCRVGLSVQPWHLTCLLLWPYEICGHQPSSSKFKAHHSVLIRRIHSLLNPYQVIHQYCTMLLRSKRILPSSEQAQSNHNNPDNTINISSVPTKPPRTFADLPIEIRIRVYSKSDTLAPWD